MKNTVQLCLDAERVNELDAEYCREWWNAALLNNGCWPAALRYAYVQIRNLPALHSVAGLEGWLLSFPVLERERIEDAVARLNRESNTEALPLQADWDACTCRTAASADARRAQRA